MRIKKGDKVVVIAGKEKGKTGTVYRSIPQTDQVIIEGLNVATKHQKNRQVRSQGQVVEKPMPVHVSNVALVEGDKPVRARFEIKDGKKVRVSVKSGKAI